MAEPRRAKPVSVALKDNAPWKPSAWDPEDAGALQALLRGEALPHQQQRALSFMIERLCGTYDMHYYAGEDGARNTDFALGRAFPGQQIVKLLKLHIPAFTKRRNDNA